MRSVLKWQHRINTFWCLSFMLIKQQNSFNKGYSIMYTVNIIQCYLHFRSLNSTVKSYFICNFFSIVVNFRALRTSFCWQALWRCCFHFPTGLGTCPHCQRYQKLVQWPWCYCAWLTSKPAWPEPHRESETLNLGFSLYLSRNHQNFKK